jgi:hypothetical protein
MLDTTALDPQQLLDQQTLRHKEEICARLEVIVPAEVVNQLLVLLEHIESTKVEGQSKTAHPALRTPLLANQVSLVAFHVHQAPPLELAARCVLVLERIAYSRRRIRFASACPDTSSTMETSL